jgi:hypothetical protein
VLRQNIEALAEGGQVRLGHSEDHEAAIEIGLRQETAPMAFEVLADALHGLDRIRRSRITRMRGQAERSDFQFL